MGITATKMKKCPQCKSTFVPTYTSTQRCCSMECAITWGNSKSGKSYVEKQYNNDLRERKKDFYNNDLGHWTAKLDRVFNKYIRERDRGRGCISCGIMTGQFHAGHYRPKGGLSGRNYRWHEENVHLQCSQCNNIKSGNLTEYRIRLIRKIGEESVLELETQGKDKKYTCDDIRELIKLYKEKLTSNK